jgi:uncharacterized protein DUF1579
MAHRTLTKGESKEDHMNLRRGAAVAIGILLTLTCVERVLGQAPSGPPKPGPEHQKLAYFAGKWVSDGETKPSPFGPGGKFTFTQNCEWFTGGFALVCHSEGKMQEGTWKGLSIMSYDPGEKTYTYFETNTLGENVFSRGTVEGDTWTWTSESKMGGKPVRQRFTLKQVSADSSTYKFEMGSGDEPLKVIMEGKQTRVK